jgi:hypothetical protein
MTLQINHIAQISTQKGIPALHVPDFLIPDLVVSLKTASKF